MGYDLDAFRLHTWRKFNDSLLLRANYTGHSSCLVTDASTTKGPPLCFWAVFFLHLVYPELSLDSQLQLAPSSQKYCERINSVAKYK